MKKNMCTVSMLYKGSMFLSVLLCLEPVKAENNFNIKDKVPSEIISEFLQSEHTITGIVKDENGLGIPGVNIMAKGTTTGTITDINGHYSLQIPKNSILIFTYIGYRSQEVKVTTQKVVDITLKEDTEAIDEVVVIGYGSTRKQDLSTAVATVKVDQALKSRPSNMASLLQGQMPGVTVTSNGGDPLSETTLSIRGRGSRGTDSDPSSGDAVLYVVDGVPGAPFNMEDVESITVLKDAASAAIYGASVGSGGVVVVTTKQAATGKIKINFNISKSYKKAWKLPSTLTSEQYNQIWKDAISLYGGQLPVVANPEKFPYGNITRTNWMDEIFRTGSLEHYALSLSGGSETIKGIASFSYDKDDGILRNTYSRKFGAKIGIDFQVTQWLKIGERVTYQYTNGQGDVLSGHQGVLSSAVFFPRSASVYDYDKNGQLVHDSFGTPAYHGTVPTWAAEEGISGYGEVRNPVATLMRLDQNRPSSKIYSTTSVEINPITQLTLRSDFTAGLLADRFEEFIHKVPEVGRPSDKNERNIARIWDTNWIWETTATYAQLFGQHHLSLMGGYTMKYEKYRYDKVFTSGYALENEHSHIFGQAGNWSDTKPEEDIWEESMISMFARAGYSFADRYFFTGSIRRDATSKLWKDNNSGIFPAISASWKISSEPFFEQLHPYINLFKLRASWGQVGNVAMVPRYSWNVPMGELKYPVIYGKELSQIVQDGVYAKTIGTKDLRWETTEQYGIGLDLGLFDNSLNITVDYFHKTTKDLIERVPIPSVAGIDTNSEPYGNIGKVLNRGWELGANYTRSIGKVTFGIHGNISTVHNEVLDLGSREFMMHTTNVNSLYPLRSAVGQPWYSYHVLKTEGIFQNEEEIKEFKWTDPKTGITKLVQPNAKPGDFKYVDFNNDGQINDDDKQYMGSYLPKITFGFGGNLNWNGLDFSFLFQGVGKVTLFNGFKQMGLTGRMQQHNMLSEILHAWDYDKSSGIPRLALTDDSNGNFTNVSDFYLENGSYLRLKNITVGYTLPPNIMRTLGLPRSTLRFYVSGENLCTMTDYTGFDPEVGNYGLDGGVYPVARSFSLGVNFNF